METFFQIFVGIAMFIFAITYVAALLYFIFDMVLLLIPAIKCRKVKDCLKDDCPYRIACRHTKLTEWEKLPPRDREPKEQKKKPSNLWRIYQWFKDLIF